MLERFAQLSPQYGLEEYLALWHAISSPPPYSGANWLLQVTGGEGSIVVHVQMIKTWDPSLVERREQNEVLTSHKGSRFWTCRHTPLSL